MMSKHTRQAGQVGRAGLVTLMLLASGLISEPAAAQDEAPALAIRPFVLASEQVFAARETFEAAFGQSIQPFYGGGLTLVSRDGLYVDLTASRFRKVGQRAVRVSGQTFRLGIPLTATITPLEFALGYRFRSSRLVAPFAGAGIGSYRYQETSEESDPEGDIDMRKLGYLAVGGVDFRLASWFRAGIDVQYTHVTGILGEGGISREAGEHDLGGMAARLKLTVGR